MSIPRRFIPYCFIFPSFLLVGTFLYYPVFTSLFHSFTRWDLASSTWVGLANYRQLFSDAMFLKSLANQAIFMISDVLKALVFPLIIAELIHLLAGRRTKYLFRTGFSVPLLVPPVVVFLLWQYIYDPNYGLLNQALDLFGMSEWARPWLGDGGTALWAIVLVNFPFAAGLSFLIYYAEIGNMNKELIEAARMDGAAAWKVITRIHIPLLVPSIRTITILTLIASMQDFVKILVLTGGGPGDATVVPALVMYDAAFTGSQYGYGAAIGTCLMLIVITITLFNMKFLKSKM